jgi:hypothetical protein
MWKSARSGMREDTPQYEYHMKGQKLTNIEDQKDVGGVCNKELAALHTVSQSSNTSKNRA